MFLTEQEILDTPRALERTCRYFDERLEEHKNFFARNAQKKFAFFGCGSSYMLAKSAAAIFGAPGRGLRMRIRRPGLVSACRFLFPTVSYACETVP